ncbi:unnamed protein product [Allacma fusca]|uniref:MAP3K TRAFs-binding domain-containing protein n=1 Tax=Allacma fusca TaxID=39272 RepID=A0A8J2PW79_9HEXA|nr:unnamed protein product [Allacma fusca]
MLIRLRESFLLQQVEDTEEFWRFQTADVTLIDLNILGWKREMLLFFHLGVREILGQGANILLSVSAREEKLLDDLKDTCTILHYEPIQGDGEEGCSPEILLEIHNAISQASKKRIRTNHEVESSARLKIFEPLNSDSELAKTLSSLRESEKYQNIINLVENLPDYEDAMTDPQVMYSYVFALSRSNCAQAKDKALEILLSYNRNGPQVTLPELLCLSGRIYKDKFQECPKENRQCLDDAIQWYRKAFEVKPSLFAGINLLTLLVIKGEQFLKNSELKEIGIRLSYWLGKRHGTDSFINYWDLATWLELNLLSENVPEVVSTVEKITLRPPKPWCLASTLKNIDMILNFQQERMNLDPQSHSALYASLRNLKECAQG